MIHYPIILVYRYIFCIIWYCYMTFLYSILMVEVWVLLLRICGLHLVEVQHGMPAQLLDGANSLAGGKRLNWVAQGRGQRLPEASHKCISCRNLKSDINCVIHSFLNLRFHKVFGGHQGGCAKMWYHGESCVGYFMRMDTYYIHIRCII